MYRIAMEKLLKWKESKRRKPLIIEGARQVGKTWLMKEFGRLYYTDTVYINFDSNSRMAELFASDLDTERLIMGLELYSGRKIDPDHTLLIFDEVQEVPRALSSLKYFYENAPEYHIVCAGSLLGIALHEGTSFPVGKVDFLKLFPLSFKEFLMAAGKERYAELLSKQDYPMITSFKQTYIDALKQYYFVGGMPEAVQSFAENKDFNEVREIQKRILAAYEQDFSKHAPNEIVPKIRMLWNSIPSQLARKNKKFVYGLVREGARAKDYETAILWLSDCGLVHKISRVNAGGIPLKAYEDLKAFKLFLVDVGLLGCIIAQFSLVGSGAKNLITRNGNGPYDLDYNLVVIKADERYWKDLRLLKNTVRNALNKAERKNFFSDAMDSRSCLTTLLHFNDSPNVEFSFDVAILTKNRNGDYMRLIHNKNAFCVGYDQYTWNEVPKSHDVKEKADAIKAEGLWQEARDRYVELKSMYLSRQDNTHPSFIVYVEAVNEIYYKYFR